MESAQQNVGMRCHMERNNVKSKCQKRQFEKDSGICASISEAGLQGKFKECFDLLNNNYSTNQRNSACSSVCSSVCSSIPATQSPDTTSSSAYSSAASSCCDNETSSRPKSGITMPSHYLKTAKVNNDYSLEHKGLRAVPSAPAGLSSLENRTSSTAVPFVAQHYRSKSRPQSSGSSKSDQLTAEDNRHLRDPVNGVTYEKRRLLGKGGFAKVYEVVELGESHDSLIQEQSCAAKVIDKSRLSRPEQREKVDAEVELLIEARGHPNVVHFIDSFEDDNIVCILMELCDKKSLAQYLRKKQCLSEPEVCEIALQIVAGLSHLHGKGIIHRDLKLGNILLTDDKQVKIGDFGLATRVEWGKKKTICGTPNFIAPEVLQRQGHGPEADIWALGCLLYTLIVGRPPFETYCLRETYRCILKNSYRIPSTVSPEASDLIRWMLRHKPKSRPTLSEVSSHAFFMKHNVCVSSVRPSFITQATVPDKNTCVVPSAVIASCPSTETSSDDKSCTIVRPNTNEVSVIQANYVNNLLVETSSVQKELRTPNKNIKLSSNQGSKSPVKLLASRLQKKFNKVRSFRKSISNSNQDLPSKEKSVQANSIPTACDKSATGPTTWISKWVDYSNRYGFGYQLANGRMCVLFNDGKHISMLPESKIMEYTTNEGKGAVCFSSEAIPSRLEKYVAMFQNFSEYMNKNLRQNKDVTATTQQNDARLLTWRRTEQYVAMYLSDGTLQVNFCKDHVKINISSIHGGSASKVTIMDSKRSCTSYNAGSFASNVDPAMKARIEIVHQLFHRIFPEVSCLSHPFCGVCMDAGCIRST